MKKSYLCPKCGKRWESKTRPVAAPDDSRFKTHKGTNVMICPECKEAER